MRFAPYGKEFMIPQTSSIDEEELYVRVDPLQYNNPAFGTQENPILVFSYKGVDREITFTSVIKDDKGYPIKDENGKSTLIDVSVEPSVEEHRYNVLNYLTYLMDKKEFKDRFKN